MASYTKLIDEKLFNEAVKQLDNIGKYAKIALRLQSIISSKKNSTSQTAKFFDLDRTSIIRWIKRFKKYGIAGLEDANGRGRKSLFTKEIKEELQKLITQDCNVTLKKLKLIIIEKFKVNLSKSAIHNQIKLLGFSHITGRPSHYKQDKEKLEEFKKNSKRY